MINPIFQRQSYNFDLPEILIAQTPLKQRDHSKLLMANRREIMGHHRFFELADLLPQDCLLVLNNSKVFASRLFGKTEHGGKIELFLLEAQEPPYVWQCLAKPLKKLKIGSKILFGVDAEAIVIERPPAVADEVPTITVRFNLTKNQDMGHWLQRTGIVPLPPYIERETPKAFRSSPDQESYQTVYAEHSGSAAAPTAGLHFTPELLQQLSLKGIECCNVTLHVGSGTFLPVKSEDIRLHRMHAERYSVPQSTVAALIEAKEHARPIIAVGTTSMRSLEAFAAASQGDRATMNALADKILRTSIFVHPEESRKYFEPHFATGMITNFHQPESSLLMFVSALMGPSHIQSIYETAIADEYRFFSYGDACLFWFSP
jgi:S-adenosylmethionine:tRNA ribosyltransferase-isomerase